MTAAAQDRPNTMVATVFAEFQCGIAAAETLYEGCMAAPEADGYLIAAGSAASGPVSGVVKAQKANTAAGASDGDVSADLLQGLFWVNNSSTHAVTQAYLGQPCYAEDDNTVGYDFTDGPYAGTVLAVDSTLGVLVAINASVGPLQQVLQDMLSAEHYVDIPFDASWYEIDGTALAAFADGASNTPGVALDNSEGAGIRWNNSGTPDPICRSIPVPADLDESVDVVMTVVGWKSGATVGDAVTFDVGVFNNPVGALHDADADYGGTSSAFTGDATAKTIQQSTLTLALANLPDPDAAHASWTVTLQPTDGTLGTDDVTIGFLRIAYTRKLRTS